MHSKSCCRHKEKGAITVFLALIFMSVIVFAGAVIDIVRITAAERKVQSALSASARSVLAGYDRSLIGDYGIYGVNAGTANVKNDFYRYLTVNLEEHHKGFSYLNIEVDREDVQIQGMESMLNDAAFKRQVQEYMKYRMPISVTQDLIGQLQNIKLGKKVEFAIGEKDTRDKARELRTKANSVNAKLTGVKRKLAGMSAEKLEEVSKELSEILMLSSSIHGNNSGGLLEDYYKSREAADSKAEEGECIKNQSEEFASIKENSESLAPKLQKCITEINKTSDKVRPLVKAVKKLEKELDELKEELADLKDELSEEEGSESSTDGMEDIREEIADIKEAISELEEEFEELEDRIDEEMESLRAILGDMALEGYILKDEAVQPPNKKAEELKGFIMVKKEEIKKALLKQLEKDWLISAGEFNNTNMIIGENFSIMDEAANYSSSMSESKAEESNDSIIKSMEKLSKAVEDAASNTMERMSTIEYVMDKYTFLTSKTERDHFFKKGEVEYIISGTDSKEEYNPIKNTEYYIVTDVLLQVWALRFAIDTIDNFVRSVVVFPPQRLAFALAEGALDSSLDMFNMLQGEGIAMCPKSLTAIRLKYSDHLKILLMMKPEEEILRKARQLMQANMKNLVDARTGLPRKDFRLKDYSTVISASVEAKVNLFFLPMLKVDKLLPGSFEGGSYKIRKQIYMGY